MSQINWDNFKCRCSGIHKIMANSRSNPQLTEKQGVELSMLEGTPFSLLTHKQIERLVELQAKRENSLSVILSDTCIEYLSEVYYWEKYGIIPVGKESMELQAMQKGKKMEGQAATLLSFVDDTVYQVHKDRIDNEFLSGEIDLYLGDSVYKAHTVADIKCAFDAPTFGKKVNLGLANGQEQQLQGYGDITGAQELYVVNALVDNPEEDIEDMKWRIAKRMNAVTVESPDFLKEWGKWERSMRFGHIPPNERISKIKIEPFTEFERQKVYDRVKVCREWLWKFDESMQNMNLVTAQAAL